VRAVSRGDALRRTRPTSPYRPSRAPRTAVPSLLFRTTAAPTARLITNPDRGGQSSPAALSTPHVGRRLPTPGRAQAPSRMGISR